MTESFSFIHISDTHIGKDKNLEIFGRNTYNLTEKVVRAIESLPFAPLFVMHNGDIIFDPFEEAVKTASTLMSQLKPPVYYVNGNHDDAQLVAKLTMGPRTIIDSTSPLFYEFDCHDHIGIVLDGRIPGSPTTEAHGLIPDNQLAYLDEKLANTKRRALIFVHYPPFSINSSWLDEHSLLLNGMNLHEILAKNCNKVRGVFFGHIHRSMQMLRDGVLYASVASTAFQFNAWPIDNRLNVDDLQPPSFNVVTVGQDCLWIKHHSLA